jgi:hypothetical protein
MPPTQWHRAISWSKTRHSGEHPAFRLFVSGRRCHVSLARAPSFLQDTIVRAADVLLRAYTRRDRGRRRRSNLGRSAAGGPECLGRRRRIVARPHGSDRRRRGSGRETPDGSRSWRCRRVRLEKEPQPVVFRSRQAVTDGPRSGENPGAGRCRASDARSSAAYMPECMYERPPPFVLSGSLPPGGGVALDYECSGLATRHNLSVLAESS